MVEISRRRFFSEFYDSVNQRNYSEVDREIGDAKTLYIGRLRFDSLLSKVLVFTDAQLLDGTFFQKTSPTELDDAIGRIRGEPAPIEIRARVPSLSDALLGFVKRPDSTVTSFEFSLLSGAERGAVQDELTRTSPDRLTNWRDLIALFRAVGVNTAKVEELEESWALWLGEERLEVRPWANQNEFSFADRLLMELRPKRKASNNFESASGRAVVERTIAESITVRSEFRNTVAESVESHDEGRILNAWYDRAYIATQAVQHMCDNYEVSDATQGVQSSLAERIRRLFELPSGRSQRSGLAQPNAAVVPEDFVLHLGGMKPNHYRLLLNHGELSGGGKNRLNFENWWSTGDESSLKRGLEPFIEYALKQETPAAFRRIEKEARPLLTAIGGGLVGGWEGAVLGFLLGLTVEYATERSLDERFGSRKRLSRRILKVARERGAHGEEN